ncbi:MAG: hypothetical protein HQL97_00265 [Magnetococcales bacterium]|nr:hypothetical protein [Magnetococcales bacterium]
MDAETKALRDHFAGQAMAGILTTPIDGEVDPKVLASMAYEYADAMLAERSKADEQAYQDRLKRGKLNAKNEQVRQKAAAEAAKREGESLTGGKKDGRNQVR